MARARNASTHAQDLDDGRVLAPDEVADVDLDQPHNAAALAAGVLTPEAGAAKRRRRTPTEED